MSDSSAPKPRDASGLTPTGQASSENERASWPPPSDAPPYYAHRDLVFRKTESGYELVAEVYGSEASRGGEYEASGNSRAEHIARLLNEHPFPGEKP